MSGLLLAVCLLVLWVLVTVVISTLKTGISPQPSHLAARHFIIRTSEQLMGSQSPGTLVDLGSGWGHLVVPLARRFPQHQVVGYEVSFFPWLVSWLLKKLLGLDNLKLYRRNFLQADLSKADLLICYLVRPTMHKLAARLEQMDSRPRFLLSHFFSLPGYSPQCTWQLPDWNQSPFYLYCLDKQSLESLTHV
jgi:methylase of polypeptide subunit release factors